MKRLNSILFLLFVFSCEDKEELTPFEGDISLNIYEIKYFSEQVEIEFLDVVEDLRCPQDHICGRAGNGRVLLRLNQKGQSKGINFILNTIADPETILLLNYKIRLKELNPYPQKLNSVRKSDYSMVLNVEQID